MTTHTNWPNLEQPGYHWLKCKTEENSELEIFHYDPKTEMFSGIGDVGCIDEACFVDHWEYHGPVLTPTQIAEMLAGERERAAQEAIRIGESRYGTVVSPTNTACHIAHAIRNLGGAP